jgi:predicted nuclease of predicted toxin-antitoxin system
MKLLLDMNMPVGLCLPLIQSGHRAVHWRECGSPRAEDSEILAWAKANDFVLVTQDLDFSAILAVGGLNGPSVIQVRVGNAGVAAVFPLLLDALSRFEQQLGNGALIVVDKTKSRVRILPLR